MKRILTAEEQFFSEEEYQDFVQQTKLELKQRKEHFMPIKQPLKKPTTEEKQAAQAAQSPSNGSKLKQPLKSNSEPKMRTLKEAHLDSERASFVKARQLFPSYDPNDDTMDENEKFSNPFIIHGARRVEGKFGTQVNFLIQLHGDEDKWTLQLSDNDERGQFVNDFRINTTPIKGCVLENRQLSDGKSYWKITSAEENDIPF